MSRDELYEALVSLLNSMSNEDARAVFNEYCSEYGSFEDYIYDNDEYDLNEYFQEDSPYEILCRTGYGDYSISHDYFRTDGYGNVRSFNSIHSADSPFYADELADYIIDNETSLGNSDIEDLLDEYNESNDDFEESLKRRNRTVKESRTKNPVRYLPVAVGKRLGIENYPNFSASGSVSGMRKQYYGDDALLVKCGSYIYNVTDNPNIYNRAK